MISVLFKMEQVEVQLFLFLKVSKECSLSKQLIQDLDYSIRLILHSRQRLSCLKSGVRVGSQNPFFRSNYCSGIVSTHRNLLICVTDFFESE